MNIRRTRSLRPLAAAMGVAAATLLTAVAMPAQAQISGAVVVQDSSPGWLYDLGAVISIFVDAPLEQPEPVAIGWAPPPMLVEDIPPPPTPDATWTGGYWTWQGDWVWSAGRWVVPPRPRYVWVQPYYEHRDERVIFVPGYWSRPDVEFIAPAYDRPIPWAYVSANVVVGPPPSGPAGIFIPPPPGSRPGIIIPAPVGTPPAVIVSAPPVMQAGMRIRGDVNVNSHNTVVNDNRVTNYNVTNVRNVTNVIIEAPAAATANGHAFQATVPHQAHLAAALKPVVQVRAPVPTSHAAVQAYVPGHTVAALPPPQKLHGMPAVPTHPVAVISSTQIGQLAHAPVVPPQHAATPASEAGPKNVSVGQAKAPQLPVMATEQQNLRTRQEWDRQQAQTSAQAQQHAQQQQQQKQAEQAQAQAAVQKQQHAQEQAAAQQREQQQLQQQRAQADAQAHQREQVQRERAQADARAAQARQEQRAQAEGQARQQQQAQREHAQAEARAAQAQQQQRAQLEAQAHQREQQQAQQQRMQAEHQHAQQAQREAAAHAEQERAAQRQQPQQQHAEHAHPNGEGASHSSDGHG